MHYAQFTSMLLAGLGAHPSWLYGSIFFPFHGFVLKMIALPLPFPTRAKFAIGPVKGSDYSNCQVVWKEHRPINLFVKAVTDRGFPKGQPIIRPKVPENCIRSKKLGRERGRGHIQILSTYNRHCQGIFTARK